MKTALFIFALTMLVGAWCLIKYIRDAREVGRGLDDDMEDGQ